LGDIEAVKADCTEIKSAVGSHVQELEQLTKIVTEVETLKDIQGKAEQTFKEDLVIVDNLTSSISENEQILKKNLAHLKTRLEAYSK
jgi:nicotinate-nucleotide pyrophosphorylase